MSAETMDESSKTLKHQSLPLEAGRDTHLDAKDVEKAAPVLAPSGGILSKNDDDPGESTSTWKRHAKAVERMLVRYNLEERGIQRVLPEHRHDRRHLGFKQIFMLWFSVNLSVLIITLGMLGPVVFSLPFLEGSLLSVFGALSGSVPVAYLATFGPPSGNRTMVLVRYAMGWHPCKIIVIFALINFIGYSLIDVVIAGQILSATSTGQSLSIVVGIIIAAVITWAVTTFGYSVFHIYERYAWIPQFAVIMILAGVAGPKFDLYANPSAGLDSRTITGNRVSFFSLCFSAFITYSPAAADYFVYFPIDTPRLRIFAFTLAGLVASATPVFILGVGLGSGVASNKAWSDAYEISQGALVVEALRPLGGFGLFCAVVISLGLISNIVPSTYSGGMDWQVLSRYFAKVPRVVWNTVSVVIFTVCAIAGREHLAAVFTNFLALMGYFVSIFFAIFLEEHLIFRKWGRRGWQWDAWNDRSRLPLGIAALAAFLVGWAGAILCMAQVWYIGPIAALVGKYGADLGNYVGFAWSALVFPPLRWLELRKFGR